MKRSGRRRASWVLGCGLALGGLLSMLIVDVPGLAASDDRSSEISWWYRDNRPGSGLSRPEAGIHRNMTCFFYELAPPRPDGLDVTVGDGTGVDSSVAGDDAETRPMSVGRELELGQLVYGLDYYRECRWLGAKGELGEITGDQGVYTRVVGGWDVADGDGLIDRLLARVEPPDPVPVLSPPADAQLVGVPTRLSIAATLERIEATDSILGVALGSIRATPVELIWDPGATSGADELSCDLTVAEECEFVYGMDSGSSPDGTFAASVSVRYEIEYTLDVGGVLTTGTRADVVAVTDFPVRVNEIEAVLD